MRYQVVARTCSPSGDWDYYPYWSPVREREAAVRLAIYAAQTGREAAILQSVTEEMLVQIGRGVVDRQDAQLLPALRYLPGARVATSASRPAYGVETVLELPTAFDPYQEGPVKAALDELRLSLEEGAGGDVVARAEWRQHPVTFPQRLDVLKIWLRLRRGLLQGSLGGPLDGSHDDDDAREREA